MRTWLRDAGAAFLAAGVVMALLLDAGGIWDHVGGDDLHGHLLPRYVETAQALLHEHRLPLWNPWEYCGAPLLGEAQGLTFYLPAPLLFTTSFNFRDEIMPVEVVEALYCTHCSQEITHDSESMIQDNGWAIKFDMEVAQFMKHRLPAVKIRPSFIFDEGYCTWRGVIS